MIARLENAMEGQRKKLESITKSIGETDDEVSGYGMDDNSSKDNDEEAVGGPLILILFHQLVITWRLMRSLTPRRGCHLALRRGNIGNQLTLAPIMRLKICKTKIKRINNFR